MSYLITWNKKHLSKEIAVTSFEGFLVAYIETV